MKRNIAIIIFLMLFCLFVNNLYAEVIINTGTNSNPDSNYYTLSNTFNYPYEQSLAVKFNLSEPYVITGVTTYMKRQPLNLGDNYVRVSLWTDGGDIPGSPLGSGYEAFFLVNNTSWGGPGDSGLSWTVSAGVDYWLVFDGYDVSIDTSRMAANSPGPDVLANAVYHRDWSPTGWSTLHWDSADYDLTVFVTGDPIPACEGDFDKDGDVDGSDLSVFAADFGRTDCPLATSDFVDDINLLKRKTKLLESNAAEVILTTGEPPQIKAGFILDFSNFYAAQIILDDTYEVTGVEAWMYSNRSAGSHLDSTWYTDVGGFIGTWMGAGYSMPFTVPYTPYAEDVGWFGPEYSTPLVLGPGTYWFVVSTGGEEAYFPFDNNLDPWFKQAVTHNHINWFAFDDNHFGWRVYGQAPIPPCEGDFDEDGDVDGSDLATFAADFGRTDCP